MMNRPTADELTALLTNAKLTSIAAGDPALCLSAAKETMETRLRRTFADDGNPDTTTRLYDGQNRNLLLIDPCSLITSVDLMAADGTLIQTYPAASYHAKPLNDAEKSSIELVPSSAAFYGTTFGYGLGLRWPRGFGNLRVSATWGSVLTDDIILATLYSAGLLMVGAPTQAIAQGIKGYKQGPVSVEYGPRILTQWQAYIEQVMSARVRIPRVFTNYALG